MNPEGRKSKAELEELLKEVQTERKQLSDIFNNAPSFMCVMIGTEHVFERANECYKQLVGNREIIGKPVRAALPEIEGQGFLEILDQVFKTGETYRGTDIKVSLQSSDSPDKLEEHWLNFVYQPIRSPDGTITGIFVQGIELTQRKKAEEALRAMNKTLEERVEERTSSLLSYQKQLRSLVSELSTAEENQRRYLATELHDNLGQLLAMCKMELDLVKGGKLPSPAASVINKVTELLNEVISYTRQLMSELKPPPVLNKEDIEAYIFWAADQMKKHGLTVSVQSNDEPKPIDEEAKIPLLQSVRELLMNVAQHSGVKKARVTTSRLENQMQVTVEDEGVGFDSEEEFIESDDGGFGLFNIQERMEMLGGRLELVSVPQQGTRATLFIPLKSEEKTGTPDRDNEKKSNSSVQTSFSSKLDQKITVLIADDHEMVRKGLRNLIEKEADLVVIAEAADGTEAVKFAGELFPDVIVMDVNMPAMDGIEATQLIKKKMPEVYIIGLSLHDDEQVSNEMRKAGASAYLSKTEAFETLCATIRNEFNPSV